MDKKKRHVLYNYINSIIFNKNQLRYFILKSIKFNRNIKNNKKIINIIFSNKRKNSISKYKNICLFSGYKRAIVKKTSSSRFITNKLAKLGLIQNYRP